jgi:uncharacterized RDD family membrane protein YckC
LAEEDQPQPQSDAPLFAGFWKRLAAALIDGAFLLLLFTFVIGLLDEVTSGPTVKIGVGLLLALAYLIGFHLLKMQATPGKLAMKIKVVHPDGGRANFDRIALRALASLLSAGALMLGFTMMALNPRHRALHDIVGRTVVVRANATPQDLAGGGDTTPDDRGSVVLQVIAGLGLGILLLVFSPSFYDREKRAEIAAALATIEPTKAEVAKALRESRPAEVGAVKPTSKFIKRIFVTRDGEILVLLDEERFDESVIRLTPEQQPDKSVKWSCSSVEIRKLFLPPDCRD